MQIEKSMAKIKLTRFSKPGAWSDILEELLSDTVTGGRSHSFRERCREFGIETTTSLFDWLIADLAFIRPPDAIAQIIALALGLDDRTEIDTFTASMRLASAYARKIDSDPETARTLVVVAASLAADAGLGGTAIDHWVDVNDRMLVGAEWTPKDIAATGGSQPESVICEVLIGDDTRMRESQLCAYASSRLGWHSAELMQVTTGNRLWRGPLASQNGHVQLDAAWTVLLPQMDDDARYVAEHMHSAIDECPAEFREISSDYFEGSIVYAAEMYRRFDNSGMTS
ncbi:hypothetical protein D6M20_01560 (plasmid) [Rhodococcus qingshengii]|uniref:hypothetical protein n=1 Tax=Rhodococcus qingshengii TaxID=334542 RepID=UPI0011EC22C3|nr:hypothetical protein [Rhodococcus qingshengii]QEM25542.1 hypothetical protein D6M20_01560 [Rhodococcus qingshengii]